MLGLAEELLNRRSPKRDQNKNYRGAETNDYGIKRAEEIVAAGLEAFGIVENELREMRKSCVEKVLISSIIRAETSVRIAWVAEKLQMGTTSNVTRASKLIGTLLERDKRLKRLRKKIYATISS